MQGQLRLHGFTFGRKIKPNFCKFKTYYKCELHVVIGFGGQVRGREKKRKQKLRMCGREKTTFNFWLILLLAEKFKKIFVNLKHL
jgi:hypothetical protein